MRNFTVFDMLKAMIFGKKELIFMFIINNQNACSQNRTNDILDKKQFKEINTKSGKSRSATTTGDSANRSQLIQMISGIIGQLMGQLSKENTHNTKQSACHCSPVSMNPCKPDQPNTNEPPTVNTINGSNALKSYISAFYSSATTIQDMNSDGKIGVGDKLDYGVGEDAFRYLTIDQSLADTLNQYNAISDPVAFSDPGAQGFIEPNAPLRNYLDTYYSSNAEIHEVNGDGKISAGDRISYQDAQGTSYRVVINEALAGKLNQLNL
jgi:hypothetical protein